MIALTNAAPLANAIRKAKSLRPRVQFVAFRVYQVISPCSGNVYRVTFSVNPQTGSRQGHCTCRAGVEAMACWHLAAAVAVHQAIQAVRVHAKAQLEAARESAKELRREREMVALNPS